MYCVLRGARPARNPANAIANSSAYEMICESKSSWNASV
jgi:hypothetical protein